MQKDTRPPTRCQIETVYELIRETKSDVDWYTPERMTRGQVARLIDKLLDELQKGAEERRYIAGLIDRMEG